VSATAGPVAADQRTSASRAMSFRFAAARDLAEEAAKLRAARRIWHRVATERLGATPPATARLRFFSRDPGSTPAPSPSHHGARPADSCCVEPLAGEIEARAAALLAEIDALGGAAPAIEAGIPQRWIAETGAATGAPPEATQEMDTLAGQRQAARTRAVVAARDARAFIGALLRLADDTRAGRNVMPALIAAARAGTTAGEMAGVFRRGRCRDHWGRRPVAAARTTAPGRRHQCSEARATRDGCMGAGHEARATRRRLPCPADTITRWEVGHERA